ncbi:protein nrt1/ ptr family 4.3 [Phtheirospermum japonicum]|uniref:Protein nrt1/ ptr family 4.3 n=1 Tax=Phtheirospermum japonicum TaxID=374723 RepID=A0A830B4C6_9LAMI|nr:protein nrt1/ ptr family 4.3 [Phtheirospermum japonicum]
MEIKGEKHSISEETVDWRGRPSNPLKHGGMRAAAFVLGVQGFEIMAIAAVGNNLITYVINEMHFSLSEAANTVTNFIGTVFILALVGGYLSDSHLGCFWTMLIFAFVELSGFILLSVQAHLPQLKPPPCNMLTDGDRCEEAKGFKALIFFVALYLVALGSGCVKPNMIAHGGDQFNQDDPKQSKKLSRYFNAAYFAFSMGELFALTVLVYVQTHSGMDIGFGVSAAAMAMGLISLICGTLLYRNKPPRGSILTPIAQVIVAAIIKRKQACPSDPRMLNTDNNPISESCSNLQLTQRFRFLNKACIKSSQDPNHKPETPWTLCTVPQVEQVKTLILVIPIFACTIVFNTILAQLQTFSVQQGSSMNTHLTKSFRIPPASLQAIPYAMLIFIVPLYDTFFVPFARRITGHDSGLAPLHRIGSGLFLATFSMVSAALMENKRRNAAVGSGEILSIFWITPQFLIFGVSEMFTAVGLIEFFYKQDLKGMQAFLTAITYCSYSFGFYLSSILVSVVNKVTGNGSSGGGWLSDNNLNKDRLDLFYWFLAVLSFANFINYLFWARWYSRNRSKSDDSNAVKDGGDDNMCIP